MSLIELSSDLIPKGKPDFKQITAARTIENLLLTKEIEKRSEVRNLLAALIRDFCAAFNFAHGKNLNEVQTVEVACIYLDEVDDYSIEDFVMMFSMAKRGLIKDEGKDVIFDRIDIHILLRIKALYNKIRWEEWDKMNEEELRKKEGAYVYPEKGNTNRWPEVLAHFKEKVAEGKKEREDLKEERQRNFIANRETMIKKLAEEARLSGDTLLEQHYLSQIKQD